MKKNLIIAAIIPFLLILCYVAFGLSKTILDDQKFMALSDASTRWGHKPFSAEAFNQGPTADKASMVVSLIESKQFVGKTPKEVKTALGDFTGYFWSERVPAYIIEEGWRDKKDTWQLLFLLGSNGLVEEVRIHKNCCYKNSEEKLKRLDAIEKTLHGLAQ